MTRDNLDPTVKADLIVLSNPMMLGRTAPAELYNISKNNPYVMFSHDYMFCNFRLYFPMEERCKKCVNLPFWKDMHSRAKLNVYMSPLHRDANFSVMPDLQELPHILSPCAMDVKKFDGFNHEPMPGRVLGLNCLLPFKGRDNVLKYAEEHLDLKFTFAGQAEGEQKLPKNCEYVGPVRGVDLRELHRISEFFIHLPGTPQPCERTVVDAALYGLKLIVNPLVGITSFPWFYNGGKVDVERLKEEMKNTPEKFWREIENVKK